MLQRKKRELMKAYKYKLSLWKAYFDIGFGLLNYLKYPIFFIGLGAAVSKVAASWIILFAFGYGVICFLLGWAWIRFGFLDAQNEVANNFNPFCRIMLKDKDLKLQSK